MKSKKPFFINKLQPILKDSFQLLDTGSVPNWLEWDKNLPIPNYSKQENIPFGSQDTKLFFIKSQKSKKLIGYTLDSGLNKSFLPKGICGLAPSRNKDKEYPISSKTSVYNKDKTLLFDIKNKYIDIGISTTKIEKQILNHDYIVYDILPKDYLIGKQIWLSKDTSKKIKNTFITKQNFHDNLKSVLDTGTNISLPILPKSKTYERLKNHGGGVPSEGWNILGFDFIYNNISKFYVDFDNNVLAILPKKI